METFGGDILHSSLYRNPAPYAGKRMLVVGLGNSGGEIALDLAEAGVDVTLSVRGPVNILPRDLLGLPILTWAIAQSRVPARVADALNAPIIRLAVGSIENLGLVRAAKGPRRMTEEDGRVPLLDVGTVAMIRAGRIKVRGDIARFEPKTVVFAQSPPEPFDAVVLATGFRPAPARPPARREGRAGRLRPTAGQRCPDRRARTFLLRRDRLADRSVAHDRDRGRAYRRRRVGGPIVRRRSSLQSGCLIAVSSSSGQNSSLTASILSRQFGPEAARAFVQEATMKFVLLLAAAAPLAGAASPRPPEPAVVVTPDNFPRAESDLYFASAVKDGGLGKFLHRREPIALDRQTVTRVNRDTLYSGAVFDLDAGPVTITLPDAGRRFMSMQAVDEDAYTDEVVYGPGRHTLTKAEIGTRYVLVAVRIFVDAGDPKDVGAVNALQDAIKVEQPGGPGSFHVANWDASTQVDVRTALIVLAETLPDAKGMFGPRGGVDPVRRLIGSGAAWGGIPEKDALYLNVTPPGTTAEPSTS